MSKETQSSTEVQVMLFSRNGDEICVSSGKDTPHRPASFVRQIIQGRDYPYGPFDMNTGEEIFEAFQDYQQGKMGMIN